MTAFTGLSIFGYINLGTSAVTAVINLQHLFAAPEPVTGAEIVADITPTIQAVQQVFPRLKIPADLVAQIADFAASAINAKFHKQNANQKMLEEALRNQSQQLQQ